jgi:D-lactate dehydrogenase
MIGSEGTLGFISRITYQTVVEDPFKASALVFFPDIRSACEAVIRLKPQPVSAVELLDRPALHSVENKPGLPAIMRELGEEAAALLIEVRAATVDGLKERRFPRSMPRWPASPPSSRCIFSTDPADLRHVLESAQGHLPGRSAPCAAPAPPSSSRTWPSRSNAGRRHARPASPAAPARLPRGIIFGHALEGNLHFVFTQDFGDQAEVDRYARFMDDLCDWWSPSTTAR